MKAYTIKIDACGDDTSHFYAVDLNPTRPLLIVNLATPPLVRTLF
jgi:hypothetical protein